MSKLLDENSVPSTKTELDLFTVPPTQVAVRRSFWTEVQLQNPCTDDGPYEFHLTPDVYMLDLSKNYIYFVVRIVKADDTLCTTTANADGQINGDIVAPINLLAKTFFKQVKIYLNGKLISDSGDKYAYRSFFETELNFGKDAKETQLQASMYYPDTSKELKNNKGLSTRFEIFRNSAWVELIAPIHADMFMQERYLINQCDLRIEMYRNSDAFCLLDVNGNQSNYKLKVRQMSLFMKKVEVTESINMAIESMLQNTTVKYPIRRTHLTSLHVTENRRSTPLNALFSGNVPRRLVVGMVLAKGARGAYDESPLTFQNFGLSEIKITSGTVTVPSTPYKLNFDENRYLRAYMQMFEGLGTAGDDKGNLIDVKKFKNGSTFFVFELGADGSDSSHWELVREGSTTLEMIFEKDLPASGVECIIYAEFDSMLMIDHTRQTFMDYTV